MYASGAIATWRMEDVHDVYTTRRPPKTLAVKLPVVRRRRRRRRRHIELTRAIRRRRFSSTTTFTVNTVYRDILANTFGCILFSRKRKPDFCRFTS